VLLLGRLSVAKKIKIFRKCDPSHQSGYSNDQKFRYLILASDTSICHIIGVFSFSQKVLTLVKSKPVRYSYTYISKKILVFCWPLGGEAE
jgi:hypothetical protein